MRRADVSIGMRLAPESLFARKLLLPVESQRTLDVVVAQDLLAKTPFRLDDIFHDHFARRSGDKLCVWQWVVRRQLVAKLAELGLEIGDLESLGNGQARRSSSSRTLAANPRRRVSLGPQGLHRPGVYRVCPSRPGGRPPVPSPNSWYSMRLRWSSGRPARGRSVCAVHSTRWRERAGVLRLRSQKRDGRACSDIWEEVTHALPSHTWLTELRLSNEAGKEQQIVIAGFSSAAATLVGLLGRSPLFCNAALTWADLHRSYGR